MTTSKKLKSILLGFVAALVTFTVLYAILSSVIDLYAMLTIYIPWAIGASSVGYYMLNYFAQYLFMLVIWIAPAIAMGIMVAKIVYKR